MLRSDTQPSDIILYPRRSRLGMFAFASLIFVLCAPLVWRAGGLFYQVFAALDVLFFGYAGLYFGYRLLRPRPALIIGREGIVENASAIGTGLIRWEEMASAGITRLGTNRFLVITLRDTNAFLSRQPRPRRELMRANLGLGAGPIAIPEITLSVSLEDVLAHIQDAAADALQAAETEGVWPPPPLRPDA